MQLIHKDTVAPPKPFGEDLVITPFGKNQKECSYYSRYKKLIPQKYSLRTFIVKNVKCIFVRLILFNFLLTTETTATAFLSVSTRGLSASRLARPKRTLAGLIVKKFSRHKNSLQIQNNNFMIFAVFVVGMQIVIIWMD